MENRDRWRNRVDRRGFLRSAAAITAATIPGRYARLVQAAELGGGGLLAPRPPHHDPAARQLIVLFLSGGFSHVDTFDHKPRLNPYSGKPVPSFGLRADETSSRPLLGSPFPVRACGQSGLMISELFPYLGGVADELCVIRSLHTAIVEHFQAVLAMHTGSATVPLPSLGAWISHGLGTPRRHAGASSQGGPGRSGDRGSDQGPQSARAAWPDPDRHLHRVRPHALDRRPRRERSKPLYAKAFTALLAGAGVKGGFAHGATDEHGIQIVADPVHVHDYHATILHLMGIDHTRLVYRYAGRDFRLTDVDGKVVHRVLA